jgi:2,4-diketo-3-deoxy-L-fuconate hydrolase
MGAIRGLGTFTTAWGPAFAGVVAGDRVIPVEDILGAPRTVRELLENWDASLSMLASGSSRLRGDAGLPLAQLRPLPPVQPAGQLLCAGANYRQHVKELVQARLGVGSTDDGVLEAERQIDERARTGNPYVFTAMSSAMTGAYDNVILPRDSREPDWEVELAVVIGRRARHIDVADALSHVAGYAVCNDITLRDRIFRQDMPSIGTDWLAGKCAPTLFPIGPWLTPARQVDPHDLSLSLRLNDELMQHETTSDMLFGIEQLLAYVTQHVELFPGDVLLTGSPAGNGARYGRYLKPGDLMEAEITGLGQLRNLCVAEQAGR